MSDSLRYQPLLCLSIAIPMCLLICDYRSRAEIYTYFAEAAAAAGEIEDEGLGRPGGERYGSAIPVPKPGGVSTWGVMSAGSAGGLGPRARARDKSGKSAQVPRPSGSVQVPASAASTGTAPQLPEKPHARDIQRLLAAAVSLGGGSVEEYLLAQHDSEEVPSRARVKHSTYIHMRRAAVASAEKGVSVASALQRGHWHVGGDSGNAIETRSRAAPSAASGSWHQPEDTTAAADGFVSQRTLEQSVTGHSDGDASVAR